MAYFLGHPVGRYRAQTLHPAPYPYGSVTITIALVQTVAQHCLV